MLWSGQCPKRDLTPCSHQGNDSNSYSMLLKGNTNNQIGDPLERLGNKTKKKLWQGQFKALYSFPLLISKAAK